MEHDKNVFIDDTIDLDEIRELLGDQPEIEMNDEFAEINTEEAILQQETDIEEAAEEIPADVTAPAEDETDALAEDAAASADIPEKKGEKKKKQNLLFELYGMLHDVVYLLAAVTLVFVFVVRLVGVQGDSMLPTLHNKDYLVLESNFLFGGNDLKYGDVVVLNVPHYQHGGEGPIVKRVIATEGQTIDIDFDTGVVYVDGVRLVEDYINAPTLYNWEGEFAMEYPATVPEGCIFVLGDNRNNSMDSRYAPIGMVDEQYVLGKVLFIALPGQTTDNAGNVIEPRDWGRIGLVS